MTTRRNVLPEEALDLLTRKVEAAGFSPRTLAHGLQIDLTEVERWLNRSSVTEPTIELRWLLKILDLLDCRCSSFFAEAEDLSLSTTIIAGESAARPGPTAGPDLSSRQLAAEIRRPLAEHGEREGIMPNACLSLINRFFAEVYARRKLLSVSELREFLEVMLGRFQQQFPLP